MTLSHEDIAPIDIWSAHPDFPDNPAFYRCVLDAMPSPLLVVNDEGLLVYANEALMSLAGRSKADGILTSIFEYIHPDDMASLAEAFMVLAAPDIVDESVDRPWAPVHFRLLHSSGKSIPVEVTGRNRMADPEVSGVIYDVRPAVERDIFQRVLSGVSANESATALELVIELVVTSVLEIEAAVLVHDDSGVIDVLSTSQPALATVLLQAMKHRELDWCMTSSPVPIFHATESIDAYTGIRIRELGFRDAWTIDVASPMPARRFTILAFTPVRHVPAIGVTDRLTRAAELAAVVLLRSHAEELLAHAVHHDDLTGLTNRAGIRDQVRGMNETERPQAVLFVDLDGFKAINDEFGHAAGDRVLQGVAQRLRGATRSSDVVARLGGDEFAILLAPDHSDPRAIAAVVERVMESLEGTIADDESGVRVSASVGLVDVEADGDVFDAVDNADRAMYVAKRAGGRRLHRG